MENIKNENIEQEPRFEIVFGLEQEIQRLSHTIGRIPWYKEHGYFEYLAIPKEISESSSIEDISSYISTEFNEELYKEYFDFVSSKLPDIENKLEVLKNLGSFIVKDHYTIKFTKYGTGGSYESSNSIIIVNIEKRSREKIMGVILHEIIHIGIEDLIQKYQVKQSQKERIVDMITEKCFPGLIEAQKRFKDTSIDKIVDDDFPDMKAVIEKISK
jgi:hypothetical protein